MANVYKLVNYFDVWGNKKDGYEVNNLCSEGEVVLPNSYNDRAIIQSLKSVGFLKKYARTNMVNILDLGPDFIEIEEDGPESQCAD